MWLRVLLISASLLILFALTTKAEANIKYLHINSTTVYRFNTVKITSRIQNDGTARDKLIFKVALPNNAFITGFSMTLKNIHIEGRIIKQIQSFLNKQKKKVFDPRGNRPRSTSLFTIIIQAPPTTWATFSLTYQNMLQRRHGMYEQVLYITPGQVVEDLVVESNIFETRNITELKVFPLRGELISDEKKLEGKDTDMDVEGRSANIIYQPTVEEQRAFSEKGLHGLYTIKYDILHGKSKGDIVLWNGYFVHFFSPSGLTPLPKDIVFVLDDSTSMTGNKLKQMKEAMYMILESLNKNDRFNFIQFSHKITPRKTGFVRATSSNIEAAKEYVRNIFIAKGATNINDAIIDGLKMFDKLSYKPEARSSILFFLTDGRATVGESSTEKILENIKSYNSRKIQIFAISFGGDADYTLMKKMSYLNDGVPRRIYEASDSAYQLKQFFDEISSILIKGIKFSYSSPYVYTDDIAWSRFKNYYAGSEIITGGKMSDAEMKKLGLRISERKSGGTYNIDFLSDAMSINEKPPFMSMKEYNILMEKMWAFLTLKYWMRLKLMGGEAGYLGRINEKIDELSLKYNFLTDGTTMTLKNPPGTPLAEEIALPVFEPDLYGEARLARVGNMRVFADPHFMVNLPELELPVCFEIIADKGDFLLLLEDPVSGVRVTASVVESRARNKDGRHKTYLGEVFISTHDLQVRISPYDIRLNGLSLSWKIEKSLGTHHVRVVITGSKYHVAVIVNNSTQMLIQRYLYAVKNPMQVNYLNFYVTDHTGLSSKTTGLLGYFAHAHVNETSLKLKEPLPRTLNLTAASRETGKIYPFTAHLVDRLDVFDIKHTVRCWKILPHENFALFGGIETGKFFLDEL